MSLQFEKVPIEHEDRHSIIPVGRFSPSAPYPENLSDGELKILELLTEECPLGHSCIDLDPSNTSSFCNFLGPYPIHGNAVEDQARGQILPCKIVTPTVYLDVKILRVSGCPNNKPSCVGCGHLFDTVTWRPEADRSHCHIKCTGTST